EQNLAVLARGYTPPPRVLLLGGPNYFFTALRDAWRERITRLWSEREVPADSDPRSCIYTPQEALFYGAYGAALMGLGEAQNSFKIKDFSPLYRTINKKKKITPHSQNAIGFKHQEEKKQFYENYSPGGFFYTPFSRNGGLKVYIGIDGGSTSTKGVVIDETDQVVAQAYKLSEGNPVKDAQSIFLSLKHKIEAGCENMVVKGVGFTGYAKDLLSQAFGGDTAVVETVAHTLGSLKYFPDADVICDLGGQDIKVILLNQGTVKDFRLNTQCSAGNGYYLQSTAEKFGYSVDEYAEVAFCAAKTPSFNFGCAVFLEADIVNYQQMGWKSDEIMAGLAKVLPLNVWLYVVQEPNLARLGRVFVLQGGTHNNMAVVKTQHDFITSRVKDARIHVHPYNEVAGAIGTALETKRLMENNGIPEDKSRFIGFESLKGINYTARRDEYTRCPYCKNHCLRTFISISSGSYSKRYIIATCEKGQAENKQELKKIIRDVEEKKNRAFNFIDYSNSRAFSSYSLPVVLENKKLLGPKKRKRHSLKKAVIGIPRVLNMYSTAVFFNSYFNSLGAARVPFSDFTSENLYRKTACRGSIDPCFPSKIAISHVYDLMNYKNVSHIFFPCIRSVKGEIYSHYHWACPAVTAAPEVAKASFTLEKDEFKKRKITYIHPVLDMAEWDLFEKQMFGCFGPLFGITRKENRKAINQSLAVWQNYVEELREKAEEVLIELERTGGVGIVLLGRPYHNDPGVNHGILEQLNKCGYPIFTIESLPRKGPIVEKIFGSDIQEGKTSHPMDISDIWPMCYSENSSLKIWGARFVSRHPNLIALDLSSFRCGHDAAVYSGIDDIFTHINTPYFTFHEIDENKPLGSIKLRVETIDYFLKRFKEETLQCQKSFMVV
ncbi:MAG: BadF/BadG/BcrA/BcrD ATPase family protein, partial [Spirochaetota bacterium]